jgi:hypothetical protein
MAAVFRHGGSPAVDRRWGNSSRGSRRFFQATWRELGRLEGLVPTANRDSSEGELVGEVDAVLKGGDRGAGELHEITAKLWEGLSWIGRGCGGLPTVDRRSAGEEHGRRRWIRGSG